MRFSFLVRGPEADPFSFPLQKAVINVGRSAENDLVLTDRQRSVSRFHATVTVDSDGQVLITDQASLNGTMINETLIAGTQQVMPNDVVRIGDFELVLHLEGRPSPQPRKTAEEQADDDRFAIEAGSVELAELQQKRGLLPLAGDGPADLRNLELLYEVGVKLAGSHSVEEVTAAAIDLLFKIEQVHRATLLLWDEATESFTGAGLHSRHGGKLGAMSRPYDPSSVVMSRTILRRVRRENRPLHIRDAKAELMLESAASIVRAGIQAAFCSPLSFQGRFLGVLYADNLVEPMAFSEGDFRTFTSIAAQTGLALANALARRELIQKEVERQSLKLYLPPQVADLIASSGGKFELKGSLQDIAVLFADIRGFTTMSENMEAREVVQMLNDYFTAMSGWIFECNGTLDKFIGDCIMALFGAPVPSADAHRDALRAAIGMQQKLRQLNTERARRNQNPFQIGIGLHYGPAVVGNIGSADRLQYTAIGDTVNVAARIMGKAQPAQVIVSEQIRQAVSDYPGFQPLGDVELKGRVNTVRIYSADWTAYPME